MIIIISTFIERRVCLQKSEDYRGAGTPTHSNLPGLNPVNLAAIGGRWYEIRRFSLQQCNQSCLGRGARARCLAERRRPNSHFRKRVELLIWQQPGHKY